MPTRTTTTSGSGLPAAIGRPALRALEAAEITRLEQLSRFTEAELLALHGVGPKAIGIIKDELRARGKSLRIPR